MSNYQIDAKTAMTTLNAPLIAAELTTAQYVREILAHLRNESIAPGAIYEEVKERFQDNWDVLTTILVGVAVESTKSMPSSGMKLVAPTTADDNVPTKEKL